MPFPCPLFDVLRYAMKRIYLPYASILLPPSRSPTYITNTPDDGLPDSVETDKKLNAAIASALPATVEDENEAEGVVEESTMMKEKKKKAAAGAGGKATTKKQAETGTADDDDDDDEESETMVAVAKERKEKEGGRSGEKGAEKGKDKEVIVIE